MGSDVVRCGLMWSDVAGCGQIPNVVFLARSSRRRNLNIDEGFIGFLKHIFRLWCTNILKEI